MINRYSVFNESKQDENIYKSTNLIEELCTSMTLLNNTFLDNILDRVLRARYRENTHVFLNDLKNLLTTKNRLFLGKFVNNKCIEDTEVSKLTKLFDSIKFAIDDDWGVLVDARNSARNIIDKLIPNEKLSQDMIKAIYWIEIGRAHV